MRPYPILIFALTGLLAGCAGQVDVKSGATGAALPAGATIALIGTSANDNPLIIEAQRQVVAALAAQGHDIAPDAPTRIEIGLTDRLASTGVGVLGGAELSAAKKKAFLGCKGRIHRLVLTSYGAGPDVPVTRAWAEEQQCKAGLEESIAGLAEKAVAALALGASAE